MKNSKVIVVADELGRVVRASQNNPLYGYVQVKQEVMEISSEGWARKTTRSAIIKGLVEDLRSCGFTAGMVLPGKIVVKERLNPFNDANPQQHLKIAGDSGVVCKLEDSPIYRDTVYTEDLNAEDNLIIHTNSDEIREAQRITAELNKEAIL